jgi:hypothetical protein
VTTTEPVHTSRLGSSSSSGSRKRRVAVCKAMIDDANQRTDN